MRQKGMSAGSGNNFELPGPEDDLAVQNDEELVLVFMVVERWPETARADELDHAHRTAFGSSYLDSGEMIQEVKVLSFIGREH